MTITEIALWKNCNHDDIHSSVLTDNMERQDKTANNKINNKKKSKEVNMTLLTLCVDLKDTKRVVSIFSNSIITFLSSFLPEKTFFLSLTKSHHINKRYVPHHHFYILFKARNFTCFLKKKYWRRSHVYQVKPVVTATEFSYTKRRWINIRKKPFVCRILPDWKKVLRNICLR